jgi:sugar-specific transcriptional regulator TrmB
MHQEDRETQVLIKLGLNASQAKVYLTLLKIGEATVSRVAKAVKMDRADTYRVIAKLHKRGYVKKTLTYPSAFIAIPIKDLLEILIKDKKSQIDQIESKAAQLIQRFSDEKAKVWDEYILVVPKVKMITQEIREDNRNAKKSVDILTSMQDQIDIGNYEGKRGVETCLKNGVKLRLIIEKPSEAKRLPNHILELAQYPNFNLRYIPEPSECLLVIQDNEKVWIKTGTKGFYNSPWLVSNNPKIIFLARAFFDKIFKDSTPANERKSECATRLHQPKHLESREERDMLKRQVALDQ